jgi:general secretion pathway protein A
MFLEHYHLREQPFGVTPDPRYLYFSPGHREALASLFYGIETGRGFLSLIAEPGLGKTTLLFQLLQRWKGHVHSAFLFQTQCDSRELIRYLLADLGIESGGEDIVRMHTELNDFLYRETLKGKRVILFIDEAQNLSDSVLETVRLLSDFEAPDRKLLQIVLAGQPELAERLSRPRQAQLRQRIGVQARLEALSDEEVVRYINHRLQVAGYEGPELFTSGALAAIVERSQGIPRLINHLCFNALSLGCATRCEKVNADIVREAAADMPADSQIQKKRISQTQQGSAASGALGARLQRLSERVRGYVSGRRTVQTSVISIVLGCLVIYFGARTGSGKVHPAPAQQEQTVVTATARVEQKAPASASDPAPTEKAKPSGSSQPKYTESRRNSMTYVVQPSDTLRDLCMSVLGRYDKEVLSEVRQLNPNLKNPNMLEIGQEIHIPLSDPK